MIPKDLAWADKVSWILGVQPVFMDGVDIGFNRNPRLWWTNVNWAANKDVQWSTHEGYDRIFVQGAATTPEMIQTGDWAFAPEICSGRHSFPTLLTPAPTDEGRDPPHGSERGCSPSTLRRHKQDRRQYAPWMYRRSALLWNGEHWATP